MNCNLLTEASRFVWDSNQFSLLAQKVTQYEGLTVFWKNGMQIKNTWVMRDLALDTVFN